MRKNREKGFALIFSMMVLIVLTVVVISSMKTTTSGERASGSYMDRTWAFQAAEQALLQGKALLMANSDQCLDGCAFTSAKVVSPSTTQVAFSTVGSWTDTNKIAATLTTSQASSAAYVITQLSENSLASPASGANRLDCRAYSVMGRGAGVGGGVVVLQTVVWLCPV
jgi:type IV pilus assembly protein PilX